MGYYVSIENVDWAIPPERVDDAYAAVCALNENNAGKTGGSWPRNESIEGPHDKVWFAWMPWNYPEVCPTLASVLETLGFEVETEDDGTVRIRGYDSKTGNEGQFLEACAPFISPGSYIEWRGEDGEGWREDFDGHEITTRQARVVWE